MVLALNIEVSLGLSQRLFVGRLGVILGVNLEALIVDGLGLDLGVQCSDGESREESEAHLLIF